MWKSLSPTLLLLALIPARPLVAADTLVRDQTATAIVTLVEQKMRLPAKRWLDQWMQAKYPDDGQWIEKTLWLRYAERFSDLVAKDEIEALKKRHQELRDELDKAAKDKRLPAVARTLLYGAGGPLDRIKKEILTILDPNLPAPAVILVPEKQALLERLLKSLCDQTTVEFDEAMAKVKEFAAGPEKERWNLKEEDPKGQVIDNSSVNLRIEALQLFITAHSILRDAATRGPEFGIDPAPIKEWLKKTTSQVLADISLWSFDWGKANAYLGLYCQVFQCEAFTQGIREIKDGKMKTPLKFEDLESSLGEIISTDMKPFDTDQALRNEVLMVRARACDQLMRWCVELNDSKLRQKGLETWRRWQTDVVKKEAGLKISTAHKSVVLDLGFMNLSAARLLAATKDSKDKDAALGLVAEVSGAKNMHPGLRDYAKQWLVSLTNDSATSNGGWADAATPEDPGSVLVVARQLYRGVDDTTNKSLQRINLIRAASKLRNAIYGFETRAYADQFPASAPGVYLLYTRCLQRLGLRQHAAIAGVEGLALMARYLDQWEKDNDQTKAPVIWKAGEGQDWKMVTGLAKETYRLAQEVYSFNKGFSAVAEAARNYKTRIIGATGPDSDLEEILQYVQEKKFDESIAKCGDFLKKWPANKNPEFEMYVFSSLVNARLGLLEKHLASKEADKAAQITKELDRDNEAMSKRIAVEMDNAELKPERRRLLEQVRSAILSCSITYKMRDSKFDEVLDLLGPEFWKRPPSDPGLSASMLNKMCVACAKKYEAVNKKPSKEAIADAADRFQAAYVIYGNQIRRLADKNVDAALRRSARLMSQVFQGTALLLRQLSRSTPTEPQWAVKEAAANRSFADLFEPLIDDQTKPDMVWMTATVLWEVGQDTHQRAARLFERYQGLLNKDDELQAFNKQPKAVLDGYATKILLRPEFKTVWAEIVDLAWDSPETLQAAMNGTPDVKNQTVNFALALRKLGELRKGPVAQQKSVMAAKDFAEVSAALGALDRLLVAAFYDLQVVSRLATAYREEGNLPKALPLLLSLYEKFPQVAEYASGFVEVTILAVKEGKIDAKSAEGKKQLEKALGIASKVREDLQRDTRNRDGYWLAYIQTLELTVALNNIKSVNDTMAFLRLNKSDLSRELVKPRVEVVTEDGKLAADDKAVRRPRNVQAVQLAQRFLKIFEINGVGEKPTFRIDSFNSLNPPQLFADMTAPTVTQITVKDESLAPVSVLAPSGTLFPPAPVAEKPAPAGSDKPSGDKKVEPNISVPAGDDAKVEPPKAELPKTESPKTETPKTESPKAESPKTETPKIKSPKVETPKAKIPKVEAPKAKIPKTETPKAKPPAVPPTAAAPGTQDVAPPAAGTK